MATKASEWKNTVEVELPTGHIAEIRPLGFDLVLRCERVPDSLTGLIVEAFKTGGGEFKLEAWQQVREFAQFLDTCCQLTFVHPQIVDNPQGDDQIHIDQLEFDDKLFIWQQLGKPRKWLENFRPKPLADVQSVGDEPGLPDRAEQAAETEAVAEAG